jgi:precorrin-6B methylase 2
VDRLLQAYAELLPAVNTLVANHFTRTLVTTALDYVERVGSDAERRAISDQMEATGTDLLVEAGPARSASMTLP